MLSVFGQQQQQRILVNQFRIAATPENHFGLLFGSSFNGTKEKTKEKIKEKKTAIIKLILTLNDSNYVTWIIAEQCPSHHHPSVTRIRFEFNRRRDVLLEFAFFCFFLGCFTAIFVVDFVPSFLKQSATRHLLGFPTIHHRLQRANGQMPLEGNIAWILIGNNYP